MGPRGDDTIGLLLSETSSVKNTIIDFSVNEIIIEVMKALTDGDDIWRKSSKIVDYLWDEREILQWSETKAYQLCNGIERIRFGKLTDEEMLMVLDAIQSEEHQRKASQKHDMMDSFLKMSLICSGGQLLVQ